MQPQEAFSLKPKRRKRESHMVEIARSFSFKLNLGNYQSADFFQSAKSACRDDEAEETSDKLYQFCKAQVMKSVRELQEEIRNAEPKKEMM
jgi:hypothetical protein